MLHRAALSSVGPRGEEATGAAADVEGRPFERASFELLERVSLFEAIAGERSPRALLDAREETVGEVEFGTLFPDGGAVWRPSRSNGVALHRNWEEACRRAHWELVERDRVLRAWYGEIEPRELRAPLPEGESYLWVARELPDDAGAFSAGVRVVAVLGFPKPQNLPLAIGSAARPDVEAALDAATQEAVQSLAFLWGEELPAAPPALATTPMFHLEVNQCPERRSVLRDWLDGGHVRFAGPRTARPPAGVGFADLTPPWLCDGVRVARAVCDEAEPLVFGLAPRAMHLPEHLRVHPVI